MSSHGLAAFRATALQQLQELAPAPSVGMHDVPKESIGHHLGFRRDQVEAQDPLDAKLAQHTRYVYDLQESDTPSDTSDDEMSWNSDDSASHNLRPHARYSKFRQTRQRMSIVTGQYFDAPVYELGYVYGACENTAALLAARAKRRFFQSGVRWDETMEDVIARKYPGALPMHQQGGVGVVMERGGQHGADYEGEDDEWDKMVEA